MRHLFLALVVMLSGWVATPALQADCNHEVKEFKDCKDLDPCRFIGEPCGPHKTKTAGCEVKTYSVCVSKPNSYKNCTEIGSNTFCTRIVGCSKNTDRPSCPNSEDKNCGPQTEITTTNITSCTIDDQQVDG